MAGNYSGHNGYNGYNGRGGRDGRENREIEYRILEHLGVLEEYKNDWSKEANIVAWNGAPAKVDIRDWDPDHVRMSKGITLTGKEAENLAKVLTRKFGSGRDGRIQYEKESSAGRDVAQPWERDEELARESGEEDDYNPFDVFPPEQRASEEQAAAAAEDTPEQTGPAGAEEQADTCVTEEEAFAKDGSREEVEAKDAVQGTEQEPGQETAEEDMVIGF